MTDTFNAHEQLQNQRAVAREQRRRHGADTSRDEAEVRHEAISDMVVNARDIVPFASAVLFSGLFSSDPGGAWMGGMICVTVSVVIAKLAGRMMSAMLGRFRRHIQINTEHLWMTIGGGFTTLLGFATMSYGVALAGAVLLATPFVWTRWGRHIMANTDFARMQHAPAAASAPRIIE